MSRWTFFAAKPRRVRNCTAHPPGEPSPAGINMSITAIVFIACLLPHSTGDRSRQSHHWPCARPGQRPGRERPRMRRTPRTSFHRRPLAIRRPTRSRLGSGVARTVGMRRCCRVAQRIGTFGSFRSWLILRWAWSVNPPPAPAHGTGWGSVQSFLLLRVILPNFPCTASRMPTLPRFLYVAMWQCGNLATFKHVATLPQQQHCHHLEIGKNSKIATLPNRVWQC